MAYDPQKTRNRPTPAADRPAPVDAFLDAPDTSVTTLPSGVDVEVTRGGETIVHTAGADISVTQLGDDVVVETVDSRVEVRAELDEVIVEAAGEEIHVDTTPREPFDPAEWDNGAIVTSSTGNRSRIAIALAAAVAAVVAVVLIARRRK